MRAEPSSATTGKNEQKQQLDSAEAHALGGVFFYRDTYPHSGQVQWTEADQFMQQELLIAI